jgi:hypothetical protein
MVPVILNFEHAGNHHVACKLIATIILKKTDFTNNSPAYPL